MYQGYPYYYYQQPTFANQFQQPVQQQFQQQTPQQFQQQSSEESMLPMEESYIENILRLNRGKLVNVYMTFPDNKKTFTGVIEAAGRDHIILSDPETEERYLLLMIYLDYVTFSEKINYSYTYGGQQITNIPPR